MEEDHLNGIKFDLWFEILDVDPQNCPTLREGCSPGNTTPLVFPQAWRFWESLLSRASKAVFVRDGCGDNVPLKCTFCTAEFMES